MSTKKESAEELNRRSKREWAARNRARNVAFTREWRIKNPEKVLAQSQKYRRANREKIKKNSRRWAIKNPALITAANANTCAKKRFNVDAIPVKELAALILASKHCEYCGKKGRQMSFDHKMPQSRGGKHCIKNLARVCMSCNSKKRNKTVKEFKEYCARKGHALII